MPLGADRINSVLRNMPNNDFKSLPDNSQKSEAITKTPDGWRDDKEKLMPFAEKLLSEANLVNKIRKIIELINKSAESVDNEDETELRNSLNLLKYYLPGREEVNNLIINFKTDYFATIENIKKATVEVLSKETGIQDAAIDDVFDLVKEELSATTN